MDKRLVLTVVAASSLLALIASGAALAQVEEAHLRIDGMT